MLMKAVISGQISRFINYQVIPHSWLHLLFLPQSRGKGETSKYFFAISKYA